MTVQGRVRLDVGIRYARALSTVRVAGDLDHDSVHLVLDALEAVEEAARLLAEDRRELALHFAPEVVVRLIEQTGVAARLARH